MKFFKALFGDSAEKHEDKADELRLDFEYRDAAFYYQRALDALDGEDEASADRLKTKRREVRRQAFAQLLEEATEFTQQQALDLALEKLEIAENFVDDDASQGELDRRRNELADIKGEEILPPAADEPDTVSRADGEMLELAMAGYDEEDRERAMQLGEEFRLAYEACQEERWEEARSFLDKLLVDQPEDPLILELAGTVAEFQDDNEAALEFFNRAQVVAPFRPSTIHGLVSVYRKSDSSADLRNLLARAVSDKPVHANLPEPWVQIHLDFALTLSDDGHHKEAASTILALTGVRNADRANLFYNLAGIFERSDRDDDARNALERAIEAAPRRPLYKERLADFLVQRQLEPDTALQLLVAANEVETTAGTEMFGGGGGKAIQSPNRARYLFKIAKVYYLKGEDAEAEKIITTGLAVSREPDVTRALESLREEIRAAQPAE